VARTLNDGEIIECAGGSLEVIHTPGHSKGHIALFHKDDGVMITGDGVPVPGDMPVYDDVNASLTSIDKLLKRDNIDVMLSAWDEPRFASQVGASLRNGRDYISKIHNEVIRQKTALNSNDVKAIAGAVCKEFGLPNTTLNPVFFRTISAHLKAREVNDSN